MPSRAVRRRGLDCALATAVALAACLAWVQPAGATSVDLADPPTAAATRSGTGCLVPELRGLRARVARTELEWANCSLGAVRTRHAAAWKRGYVLSQSIPADTVLRAGHRVGITIGR
ncbi:MULTISPECIES: PASTA domain-containing protein [unclassified Nocardioides]|jgi:hypothetical protein|uniref:PASTA domain-containing protein n=1 Tax=Nocardioides sp. URHA0032 TaxID=1380388 RepID=UPI00048BB1C1|nr:PASTA domain-containing protein [Nocardioides sp. URHA0032]